MDALFGPGGALAGARPGFEFRGGQQKMAAAVARAFTEGRHLVVEAGTGTGKTLAYLVPALLSEEPVILSTGTKALQEQVIARELPVAVEVTGRERPVAILKGRDNYLCRKRFGELEAAPLFESMADASTWEPLRAWAHETRTGDRAEVPGLPDASALWAQINGRRDVCIGQACPDYERCFVVEARRRAASAHLVVVNHHLLFADLALRKNVSAHILPEAPRLVLDEAHMAEEAAVANFGHRVSGRMLADLAGDAREELLRLGADPGPAAQVQAQARQLFRALRPGRDGRYEFDPGSAPRDVVAAFDVLAELLAGLADAVAVPGERADERGLLAARCLELREALDDLAGPSRQGRVVTIEAQGTTGALLAAWPVDPAELLAETFAEPFRSIVATSATLSIGNSLERARRSLGLAGAETLIVRSPFDHARQAALYVPRTFPDPAAHGFGDRALQEIEDLLKITDGRALVLFASWRALRHAADRLRDALPWPVLVQGDGPREQLVARFREEVHSVLLGTASFRQGIDIPGEALSLVIVDKLPFAVPDDPLVRARGRLIEERGGNAFQELSLPEAILSLKQALGRLIRTRSDRGLLALLDVRVRTKRYGQTVLASLPPWPLIEDIEQARAWFHATR